VFDPEQRNGISVNGKEMFTLFTKIFTGRTLLSFFNCFVTAAIRALVMPFFLAW
jgi:hypothetical protein